MEEYQKLKNAIKNEDIVYIAHNICKKFDSNKPGIGDGEKIFIESLYAQVNSSLEDSMFTSLIESLKELVSANYKCTQQYSNKIDNKYLYGISMPVGKCRRLFKYDIDNMLISVACVVPECCTITQIGRRVFISGGSIPPIAHVSEFI